MAGCEFRAVTDSRPAYLDLWQSRIAQEQGVESTGTPAPVLAEFMQAWKNASVYSQPNEWVFRVHPLQGQETTRGQHAGGRSAATGSD